MSERRKREEQPEEAAPAALPHGRVDLDVDGIVRAGRGTTGTGSPRGRRTRRPASRSGRSSRRSRGGSPAPRAWMSTASQFTNATTNAAIPRSISQTKSGIARKSRKNDRQPAALEVVVADDEPDRALLARRLATRIVPPVSDVAASVGPTYDRAHGVPRVGARTSSARRRVIARPAPPDADRSRAARSGRDVPQGRAPAAHRLVQAARRAHEARVAHARGEGARRHRDLRRKPRAGGSRGAPRRRGSTRSSSCGAARARRRSRRRAATAPQSTSRRRARARRSSGSTCCSRRPAARSSTRSTTRSTIAGQGTVGLEILEDVPDVETIVVPIGGGGLISGVAVAAAGRARVIGVEPELSTRAALGARGGRARRRDADLDRGRPQRPVRRTHARCEIAQRARRGGRARHRGRDRGRASASSTSGRSSPASRPARPPSQRCSRGRSRAVARSASSRAGTSPPQTAAGILARR